MNTLSKPKAILFDWDNTLVDTWPLIHRAMNVVMKHMGHAEWSFDQVKSNVKHSMRDAFPELFGERWQEAATLYQQSYRSLHLEEIAPLAGAQEVLKRIKAAGIYCAVVSNKRGPTLRLEVEQLGWQEYFLKTVGADDAERDKPHADPAIMALDGSGLAAVDGIWFVGDTGVDLECAHHIGASPILYGEHSTDGKMHDGWAFAAHAIDHTDFLKLLAANGVGQ